MSLKEMRKKKGLTQSNVAQSISGITQGAVSQWELGLSFPHPSKISLLAALYEVSEREIISAIEKSRQTRLRNVS